MAMIWVAIIVVLLVIFLIVGLIYLLVATSRYNKRLERDAFRRGAYAFTLAIHHQGLGIIGENCKILAFNEGLQIETISTNTFFKIPADRIRAVVLKTDKNLTEFDRSLAGRTIINDMPGSKASWTKKNQHLYLVINYNDENAELKEIVMLANTNMFKVYSFVTTVNQKLASANGGRIINL